MPDSELSERDLILSTISAFLLEFESMCEHIRRCIGTILINNGLANYEFANILLDRINALALIKKFCKVLYEQHKSHPNIETIVKDIRKRLVEANDKRNIIVHSQWMLNYDPKGKHIAIEYKYRPGPYNTIEHEYTVNSVNELTDKIRALNFIIMNLWTPLDSLELVNEEVRIKC